MTDKKWYKIAKRIVDILAYVLAAIGGMSMLESCNLRDARPQVVIIKDNSVSRETLSENPDAIVEDTKQLQEVVCEECGNTFFLDDIR